MTTAGTPASHGGYRFIVVARPTPLVAVLSLNDPDHRNALTEAMVDEICAAVADIEGDDSIGSVVVTGMGTSFCAGANLGFLADSGAGSQEAASDALRRIYAGFLAIAALDKPTIAAVNGPAVGAGMNLALAADIRIAARSARYDTRFMKLGIHPGGGHTYLLSRAVPGGTARALLLFGEAVDGPRSAELGLSYECVDDDRLLTRCVELAEQAAAFDTTIVGETKRTIDETRLMSSHAEAVTRELADQARSVRSEGFLAKLRGGR